MKKQASPWWWIRTPGPTSPPSRGGGLWLTGVSSFVGRPAWHNGGGSGCAYFKVSLQSELLKQEASPQNVPYWQRKCDSLLRKIPIQSCIGFTIMFSQWLLHLFWSDFQKFLWVSLTYMALYKDVGNPAKTEILDVLKRGAWDGKWCKHCKWSNNCFLRLN